MQSGKIKQRRIRNVSSIQGIFTQFQARTKGKMPSFGYIHRLKVKERYPGVPTDLAEMLEPPY